MRHSGAIVEGDGSAVATDVSGRERFRGFHRAPSRTAPSVRFATRWRPQPRELPTVDPSARIFLMFAAVGVWVLCGFRIGSPGHVATAAVFSAVASLVQVGAMLLAALVTSAVTGAGFGDLRGALVRFSVIVLAATGAGALFGDWAGVLVNVFTFVALVVYLFDLDRVEALVLWFFYVALNVALFFTTAAVFAS